MSFEFAPTLDALDNVPEGFRGLYVKGDTGGFSIHPDFTAHIGGLTSALDKERKNAKVVNQQLQSWQKLNLGATPEELQTKFQELTEAATKGKEGATNWEKMKADLEKGHTLALSTKDKAVDTMRTTLERHLIDNVAITALTDAKGSAALLLPHVRTQVKVIQDGENYIVRVVDKDGDPRGDGKGGYMSIKDLVAEMKTSTDFGRAFEASGHTGSGKPPASSKSGKEGGAGRDTNDLSPIQKISLGLSKGQVSRAG